MHSKGPILILRKSTVGKQAILSVEGIVPMQGVLPVIAEGKVIGVIGVPSAQDEQVALATLGGLGV